MTSHGIRARLAARQAHRVFAVSQVRLDIEGHVADVWWAEVNARSKLDVGAPAVVTVAEAVTAIHEGHRVEARFPRDDDFVPGRRFVVREHGGGEQTIELEGRPALGREILDLT